MSNSISRYLNNCLRFVQNRLPQDCLLCGGRVVGAQLCNTCHTRLPVLPRPRCGQCALPLPHHDPAAPLICGHCLKHPRAFSRTVAVYAYATPLDGLVKRCKYAGELSITAWFAQSLARELKAEPRPDLILPMPLHDQRLADRGFNQAVEIARRLAPLLDLPWTAQGCERTRDTPPQAGLDLRARRRNLRGAFRCNLDLRGKRVALLDDVMTSGASLDALAREAIRAGAAEVSAWVVARTL